MFCPCLPDLTNSKESGFNLLPFTLGTNLQVWFAMTSHKSLKNFSKGSSQLIDRE